MCCKKHAPSAIDAHFDFTALIFSHVVPVCHQALLSTTSLHSLQCVKVPLPLSRGDFLPDSLFEQIRGF